MVNGRVVYLGGEYRPWDEANVHIMSHSFGRGSAIFEVISFSDTPAGPAVFRLDEHVSRFFRSASLLGMEPPLDARGAAGGRPADGQAERAQSRFDQGVRFLPGDLLGGSSSPGPVSGGRFCVLA